jgi:hypothetical protein
MAFFKVKVQDEVYELERLTLGQARRLKREFGLSDLEFFSPTDPDQMVGLLCLAIEQKRPGVDRAVILAEVEALDIDGFEPVEDDVEENPTPAVEGDASAAESESSGQ